MKKLIYILTLAVVLPILNACDFLDVVPDNIATIDHVFRDRKSAESYLFTCYSFLPSHNNSNSNPGVAFSDEYAFTTQSGTLTTQKLLTQTGNNASSPTLNFWDGSKSMFVGIRSCNLFLDEIDNIPDISNEESLRWKAEAKFLKAYYHWYLFQLYGPIPIVDKNISINATDEEMKVSRRPVDEVVDYIVKTIDEAVVDLPDNVQGREIEELGRITKSAALAIKARVLVTAASPLFNGNNDYSSFKDKSGLALFPSGGVKAEKWQRAADACKAAIEACEANGMKLYEFKKPSGMNINDSVRLAIQPGMILGETNENTEAIWLHTGQRGVQNTSIPDKLYFGTSGASTTSVSPNEVFATETASLNSAELFYSNNGVPIEEDKTYPYENRFKPDPNFMTRTDHKFWVKEKFQTAMFHLYREPRYYGSVGFDGANWFGWGITDQNSQYFVKIFGGGLGGRMSVSTLHIKKVVPYKTTLATGQVANTNPGVAYSPYSFPIIRLADLYLMYAEALNELTPAGAEPSSVVLDYIDRVRVRSGLKGVAESWTNFSNQPEKYKTTAGMREIIQRERMIELAYEGVGGFDRRRWKIMDKLLTRNTIRGFTYNASTIQDFCTPYNIWTTDFQFKQYLWPIRTYNLQVNPNLVQNPGW